MADGQRLLDMVKLTEDQQKEGFWIEQSENTVLVWHHNNQIALLLPSPDMNHKVQDVVQRRREELKEIEEKTGWKPN